MSHSVVTGRRRLMGLGRRCAGSEHTTVNPLSAFLDKVHLDLTGRTQKERAQRCTSHPYSTCLLRLPEARTPHFSLRNRSEGIVTILVSGLIFPRRNPQCFRKWLEKHPK